MLSQSFHFFHRTVLKLNRNQMSFKASLIKSMGEQMIVMEKNLSELIAGAAKTKLSESFQRTINTVSEKVLGKSISTNIVQEAVGVGGQVVDMLAGGNKSMLRVIQSIDPKYIEKFVPEAIRANFPKDPHIAAAIAFVLSDLGKNPAVAHPPLFYLFFADHGTICRCCKN